MRYMLLPMLLGAALAAGALRPAAAAFAPDPVGRLIHDAAVGEPLHYRNLTLFPVALRTAHDRTPYTTLDEALRRGLLEITELASAEVNRVRVRNRSDEHVFLLSGEIIAGAKQDRMVEDDLLLPPHGKEVILGVYCTEHGRWSGRTSSFESAGTNVHNRLRQIAKQSRSQQEVWAEVEQKTRSLGAPSAPTSAARRVYSQAEVQSRARPYREAMGSLLARHPNACGVVAASGEEFLVADLFGSPGLFRKLWPKLLDSYVLDAIDRPSSLRRLTREEAERFLDAAARTEASARSTPGAGELYDLHGGRVTGSALVYRAAVVHLDLFPRPWVTPRPLTPVPNLNHRRQRR